MYKNLIYILAFLHNVSSGELLDVVIVCPISPSLVGQTITDQNLTYAVLPEFTLHFVFKFLALL